MNKFRPQDLPKSYIMKQRLKTGRSDCYNWQTRVEWWPCGYGSNKISIARRFKKLHYLACHAPKPVQKRWAPAYQAFYKKHFGVNGSMRYLNTWTCHAWL